MPRMNFYRSCARLLAVSGVNDFSMFDVMKPDAKRLRRNLSAIINFAKFREERLEAVNKLTVELVRTELGGMKLLGFGYLTTACSKRTGAAASVLRRRRACQGDLAGVTRGPFCACALSAFGSL